jgi:hypothetical protein
MSEIVVRISRGRVPVALTVVPRMHLSPHGPFSSDCQPSSPKTEGRSTTLKIISYRSEVTRADGNATERTNPSTASARFSVRHF